MEIEEEEEEDMEMTREMEHLYEEVCKNMV